MHFIIGADLDVLKDQYVDRSINDLREWQQCFVSLANYLQLHTSASDVFQNALEASNKLLDLIENKQTIHSWYHSSLSF